MIHQTEQLPLLCESDEESHFTFPRKHRSLYYRNSKSKINGAAFIIKNWPDHISSLLVYLWIGFIMVVITIFIIYNSLSIIDVVTPSRLPFAAAASTTDNSLLNLDESAPLNVNMHIFVDSYDDINDEFYLKYVKRLAKKFTDYKYNIIVMLKDTPNSTEVENDKIKNYIAMRAILRTDKLYRSEYWGDISIQYILLSRYLDSSPIADSWRKVPSYTIPFLVRCISIWDKGGVAFDPVIITPLLQTPKHLENLYNTLKKYKKSSSKIKLKEDEYTIQKNPKVNNIQDIIRALENGESKVANISQNDLSEAEDREELSFVDLKASKEDEHKQHKRDAISTSTTSTEKELSTKFNSQEFEYLKKTPKLFHELGKYVKIDDSNTKMAVIDSNDLIMHVSNAKYLPELTIDLKGTIVATSTACHAFIGTVFSNIRHYNVSNTIEHIITDELAIFCKGNISSCKYLDVIS